MGDFTSWNATSHSQVKLEDDYNNILAHGLFSTPAYIIRKTGSYYEAIKGDTKVVSYGGEDDAGGTGGTVFEDVIEAAITAAAGGWIHIADGDYTLLDEIDVGQSGTLITGSGKGTKITQGTADKHGFKITTKTDVTIRDLYLYGTGADAGSGVYATTTATNLTVEDCIIENWGYHGIYINASDYPVIKHNQIISNIRNGMYLLEVNFGRIIGNKINTNTRHGCELLACDANVISGNIIVGNDSANAATYDGVCIETSGVGSFYNIVEDNTIIDNDRYEINIVHGSCIYNRIGNNVLSYTGVDHTGCVNDQGDSTQCQSLVLPFTTGTTLLVGAAAWGYEIDLAGEYALAYGVIPKGAQQVLRWKIHASSIVLETHGMELLIEGQGGSDNAAFNAQAVSVASEGSVSTNFAADDWIYWQITPADDPDVDDFVAGDNIQVKVTYAAADGDNCATDATFTCVVIEYV